MANNVFAQQAPNAIDLAQQYLYGIYEHDSGNIEFKATSFNPPPTIKDCQQELDFDLPLAYQASQRVTVKISCQQPVWSLFVAFNKRHYQDVVVAKQPISKGQVINYSDLQLQRKDITLVGKGFFKNANDIIGKTCNQAIMPGTIINPKQLATSLLIKRGDHVTMYSEYTNIYVQAQGIAQDNGGLHDKIRVKNQRSGKLVEGYIDTTGKVKVI